jgi:hypothetical protein
LLNAGKLVLVNRDVLFEIITKQVVTPRLMNRGTADEPNWTWCMRRLCPPKRRRGTAVTVRQRSQCTRPTECARAATGRSAASPMVAAGDRPRHRDLNPPPPCFRFSRPLDRRAEARYGDYVKVEPEASTALRIANTDLYVNGLAYGTDYNVTLANGVRSKSGDRTKNAGTVDVNLGDKPSHVSISGDGYSGNLPIWLIALDWNGRWFCPHSDRTKHYYLFERLSELKHWVFIEFL